MLSRLAGEGSPAPAGPASLEHTCTNGKPAPLGVLASPWESVHRDVPPLINHRLSSADGLAALFRPRTGFDDLVTDDLEVNLDGSPEEVWHSLSGIYEGAVWSADEVEALRARFLAGVEQLRRPDGTVPCRLSFRQLTCRRLQQRA